MCFQENMEGAWPNRGLDRVELERERERERERELNRKRERECVGMVKSGVRWSISEARNGN